MGAEGELGLDLAAGGGKGLSAGVAFAVGERDSPLATRRSPQVNGTVSGRLGVRRRRTGVAQVPLRAGDAHQALGTQAPKAEQEGAKPRSITCTARHL